MNEAPTIVNIETERQRELLSETLKSISILSQRLTEALEEETKAERKKARYLDLMEKERLMLEQIDANRRAGNIMADGIGLAEKKAFDTVPVAMDKFQSVIIKGIPKKPFPKIPRGASGNQEILNSYIDN